jgi:hypothetical protein
MKLSFKTLFFLLLLALLLAACQGAAPESGAPGSSGVSEVATAVVTRETGQSSGVARPKAPRHPVLTRPLATAATQSVQATEPLSATMALASTWPAPLPILTADNQNLTFGPGQVVVAFAQGFQSGEDVAIALIHETQGVVFNKSSRADALGNVQAARRLKRSPDEKDGLPAGNYYTYPLTGAFQVQKFTFQVDYQFQPAFSHKGCGFYPAQAVFEGALAFFCSGLKPNQQYTLTTRLDEKQDAILTASDPFGLLIFPLRLSSEPLLPGDWLFSLGETTTQYGVPLDIGFPPLSIYILSLTEVNTP